MVIRLILCTYNKEYNNLARLRKNIIKKSYPKELTDTSLLFIGGISQFMSKHVLSGIIYLLELQIT